MSLDQNTTSELKFFNELKLNGWALINCREPRVACMDAISSRLCQAFQRSIGRSLYTCYSNSGMIYHAPIGSRAILCHSERAYCAYEPIPDLCFFLSLYSLPSQIGGNLILVDGEQIIEFLPEEITCRLRNEGVIYKMYWQPIRWREEFKVKTKREFEKLMRNHNEASYEWDGDNLLLSWSSCGLRRSWTSNCEAFANGILAHLPKIPKSIEGSHNIYCIESNEVYWGNGDQIAITEIEEMIKAHNKAAQSIYIKDGLLLAIDNTRVMHGRANSSRDVGNELLCRFGTVKEHLRNHV